MIEFTKEHIYFKKLFTITVLSLIAISVCFFLFYFGKSPEGKIQLKSEQQIGLTDSITINFDRPIKRELIIANLSPSIEGSWHFKNDAINKHLYKSMTFTPANYFLPETEYTLNISNIKNVSNFGKTTTYNTTLKSQSIPKIVSTSPSNNSENILPNQPIEIRLSEPNNQIIDYSFTFSPEAPFDLKVNDRKDVYTLIPKLEQSRQYTLKIDQEFILSHETKVSFNSDQQSLFELNFKTKNPPAISRFFPTESNVKTDLTSIDIEFNEEMNKEEVTNHITISPSIRGAWSWVNNKILSFKPEEKLSFETLYNVLIKKGPHDLAGGYVAEDILLKFSTIGPIKVTSYSPKDRSSGIPTNSNIIITFDQEVDKASAESNFSITPAIDGVFAWKGNTLTFNPKTDFQQNTNYGVTLIKGIKSVYGVESRTNTAFSFTTEESSTLLNIVQDYQDKALSCEAASLKMALSYKGVKVSETDIMNIVGYDPTIRNGNTWGDPNQSFVGNINGKQNSSGYGVHWNPIARAANNWRSAKAFTGWSPQLLANEISNGNPIVVWGITGSNPYRDNWTTPEGMQISAWKGEHARVVIGFKGTADNPTAFILNDPINGRFTWSTSKFASDWSTFNNSGVVIY